MNEQNFKNLLLHTINNIDNSYHPFVFINGNPTIGDNTSIGFFSEINAKNSSVSIGKNCDIASFVAINSADSHLKAIGLSDEIKRTNILIEDHVFIGSHSAILGGVTIGHHSVVAAGTIVRSCTIPPYSLITPEGIKVGYYQNKF